MSQADRKLACFAVKHYAAACNAGQYPKDAFRWLRDRLWGEWMEPAQISIPKGSHAPFRNPSAEEYDEVVV